MSDLPRLPRLPDPADREPPPTDEARNAATFLALLALLGVSGGLLFLLMLVLGPGALFVVGALACIPLYFVFHYVVWGRLMQNARQEPEAARQDEHS